jgi:hypothetical protein
VGVVPLWLIASVMRSVESWADAGSIESVSRVAANTIRRVEEGMNGVPGAW